MPSKCTSHKVSIQFHKKEYCIDVPSGETILETALDNGIDLPNSCNNGICSTCICKITSGNIEMDETLGLTEAEQAEDWILPCVSYPLSEEISINYDL